MELGQVAALITSLVGAFGGIWGIIKYFDVKREKRREEAERTRQEAFDTQMQEMRESLDYMQECNEKQSVLINGILEKQETMQHQINVNEKARLQTAIMEFCARLRRGETVTLTDFDYVYHMYDRYHNTLHGNSFIEAEMRFVDDCKREFDSLNIH